MQRPCKNGAICENIGGSYTCSCPIGFKGDTCSEIEHFSDPTAAYFNGNGFVGFDKKYLPHTSISTEIIQFTISTKTEDGLIFFHGQKPNENGQGKDYLAAGLVNGLIEFGYDLGSGPASIKSTKRISDGNKHMIVFKRKGSEGSLKVDDEEEIVGFSLGNLQQLNVEGDIYVGGIPHYSLMTGNRFKHGLVGCISDVQIGDSSVLNIVNSAKYSSNVLSCDD